MGKNRAVAVLNDQYAHRTGGIFVPFFGVRASTSPGVAMLALRSGAAVLPCYAVRDGPDHHTVHFAPGLDFEQSERRERDVAAATAVCNAALEQIIRRYPEQYLWGNRRFRKSPDLPRDPYR